MKCLSFFDAIRDTILLPIFKKKTVLCTLTRFVYFVLDFTTLRYFINFLLQKYP